MIWCPASIAIGFFLGWIVRSWLAWRGWL